MSGTRVKRLGEPLLRECTVVLGPREGNYVLLGPTPGRPRLG